MKIEINLVSDATMSACEGGWEQEEEKKPSITGDNVVVRPASPADCVTDR